MVLVPTTSKCSEKRYLGVFSSVFRSESSPDLTKIPAPATRPVVLLRLEEHEPFMDRSLETLTPDDELQSGHSQRYDHFFTRRRKHDATSATSSQHGSSSRGRSWSKLFERDTTVRGGHHPKKTHASALFANYGRSMPQLPTTTSQCDLSEDTISCSNLSAGLTGFPELPPVVSAKNTNSDIFIN